MSRKGSSAAKRQNYAVPKPLSGESYYLDVPRKNRSDQLEEAIMLLGGTVEPFLNKHVTCVVTDRPADMRRTSPRLHHSKLGPSRGQAILQRAKPPQSSVSCSDVMRNAQIWKIPIKTFDEFKQWLVERKAQKDSGEATTKNTKVRRLRGAFIKVEDRTRKYRPLIKEMKSWPRPNLDAQPGNGPFDDVKVKRTRTSSTSTSRRKISRKRLRKKLPRKSTTKKGYCELCDVEYEGMTRHLDSKRHKFKARIPGKYSSVDKLINSGTSLRQFVEKVNQKQKIKARSARGTRHHVADRTKSPQTFTIRRSARISAASRLLEGSTYFTLPATVTYALPCEKYNG